MSLEKVDVVDQISVVENGCVEVRTAARILEDSRIIAENFVRHVVVPGDDYSQEDARVQAVCAAVHTQQVVAQYQAQLEANKPQV